MLYAAALYVYAGLSLSGIFMAGKYRGDEYFLHKSWLEVIFSCLLVVAFWPIMCPVTALWIAFRPE